MPDLVLKMGLSTGFPAGHPGHRHTADTQLGNISSDCRLTKIKPHLVILNDILCMVYPDDPSPPLPYGSGGA